MSDWDDDPEPPKPVKNITATASADWSDDDETSTKPSYGRGSSGGRGRYQDSRGGRGRGAPPSRGNDWGPARGGYSGSQSRGEASRGFKNDWDNEDTSNSRNSGSRGRGGAFRGASNDWEDDQSNFRNSGSRGRGQGFNRGDRSGFNRTNATNGGWSDDEGDNRQGSARGGRGNHSGLNRSTADWSDDEGSSKTYNKPSFGRGRGASRPQYNTRDEGGDEEAGTRAPRNNYGSSHSRGGHGGPRTNGNGWSDEESSGPQYGGRNGASRGRGGRQVAADWSDDESNSRGARFGAAGGRDRSSQNGWEDRGPPRRGRGGGSYAPSKPEWGDEDDYGSRGPRSRPGEGGQACYKCNESGHFARECPNNGFGGGGGGGGCFKCGEDGHFARECPNPDTRPPRGGRGGGGNMNRSGSGCYSCGESGHISRECPNQGRNGDRPARGEAYIPVEEDEEELFKHGVSSGINFEKYEHVKAKVTGQDPPHRVETFPETELRKLLLENVKRSGYKNPTPVQKNAIPIIKAGRDLMACAQTGSGKTAAFLLPILHNILESGLPESNQGQRPQMPLAVVVAPTRELAIQIKEEARKFAQSSGIRSTVVYGGTSVQHQVSDVLRGVHVLIATPGRLLAFLDDGLISFKMVRFFVLDEADRMLDMGFMPDIERLENHTSMPRRGKRQTLMFSATFPDEIQHAATSFLDNYLFLQIGLLGSACGDVQQFFIKVSQYEKREKLMDILADTEKPEKTIIFVDKQTNADFLATYLCQSDYKATSVHGARTQQQREEAVLDFKRNRMPILVATAVAARGLDIPNVTHVINFDLPKTIDEYVHRIGRTGRVGNVGKATSFYDEKNDQAIAGDLVKTLADISQVVPDWLADEGRKSYPSAYRGGSRTRDIRTKPGNRAASGPQVVDDDDAWD